MLLCLLFGAVILETPLYVSAQSREADVLSRLDSFNVIWDVPGPGPAESMPLGNGDIGLNAWVEPGGDLLFYISKTDAWGDQIKPGMDGWMKQGGILSKLGLVRVSFGSGKGTTSGAGSALGAGTTSGSSSLATGFRQVLRLREGEIRVVEGDLRLRLWVDANHPVVRVEMESGKPVFVKVSLEDWRGDSVVKAGRDGICWYHRNKPRHEGTAAAHQANDKGLQDSALADITFGGIIHGPGLVGKGGQLVSGKAVKRQTISIDALTAKGGEWLALLDRQRVKTEALDWESCRKAHVAWWKAFWDRSWIFVSGDSAARETTRGYVLQRFVTACAGRGAYPIKFNGSIFVVSQPDPDYRGWGGMYWFQNTRPMYWPRLMAGDFDMMLPLFRMYLQLLPGNATEVQKYYHHGGAYFQETSPFWGGLPYMGPEVKENYTGHYFTSILELSMMMLDYYEYTGDKDFARTYLMPLASAALVFFDEHFGRDASGKLLLDPDNAIEMFWKVHDPAPDIAGLRAVLPRMVALPDEVVAGIAGGVMSAGSVMSAGDVNAGTVKKEWSHLLSILPELPTGTNDRSKTPVLLPYTGPQTAHGHNAENPELYSIYPFRLYGLDKPGLELARHTFDVRHFREKGCWNQDPIQAAMLGDADVAKDYVHFALTRKDPKLKFPAFWVKGHDYEPDEDNGGNGENGLQKMLMQTDGRKILLAPAWPKGWDADFKLHAPYNTTVQGRVVNGKVVDLLVLPASRAGDVKILTYE
ncbi:MAG TPA: DUF5703 domain-containing protein [Puia sp.]